MNRVLVVLGIGFMGFSSCWAASFLEGDSKNVSSVPYWVMPEDSLQFTVDYAYAAGGGEVWVVAGTYTSTTNPVLTMKPGVHIYGGFSGAETSRDQRDWKTNVTTLDGENARRCVVGASGATLDGFTLTRGRADSTSQPAKFGGGMYNDQGVSPTIANCSFISNTSVGTPGGGGGMYCKNSSATLANCTFTSNTSGIGGGILAEGNSNITVTGCTFTSNSGGNGGGGIDMGAGTVDACTFTSNSAGNGGGIYMSGATVRNCIFLNNTAAGSSGGGGVSMQGSSTLENCLFLKNSATGSSAYGGGVHNGGAVYAPTITNCTFWNNLATHGGGIYNGGNHLTVTNCILWNNYGQNFGNQIYSESPSSISVMYSCIQVGYSGTGNTSMDPLFVSAAVPGEFRLQTSSPCIDTGTATGAPATDIDGVPRPQGYGYDMGAYEYNGFKTTPNVVGLTQAAAQTAIVGADLTIGSVIYMHSSTVPGGCVISQDPVANKLVQSGTAVGLVVSNPITGTIVINNNRSATNNRQVTLTLTWKGGAGRGVTLMRFSDDGAHWSAWQTAAASCSHTLSTGDGYKTVRVQFRDEIGGTSPTSSDYIRLDTTPPTGYIVINDGAATTVSRTVILSLAWGDGSGTGVTRMRFSDNGSTWTYWMLPTAAPSHVLLEGLGYRTVRVQFLDGANNYSAVYSDYIKVVSP